jgi:enoyl-CoA hydratase/carnithine racemase
MDKKELLYEKKDKIAYFIINREKKRNSLSSDTINLFFKYLDKAENDKNINTVCITGAGDKAFCTGADLQNTILVGKEKAFQDYADLLKKISKFPKPTVAKIKGFCIAGGMGLMLSCDMAIAEKNSIFGTPEVNVGLFPMMIGALIFRNMPRKKAMEMILLGKLMPAEEALSIGMINKLFEKEALDYEADKILKSLASKSPIGIKIGKQAFYDIQNTPFEESLDYLSKKLIEVTETEDAKEGLIAFVQKRKPVFTGR